MLVEVQGVLEVNSTADSLERAVEALLNSKEARERLGNAGYEVLMENRGALQRLLDLLNLIWSAMYDERDLSWYF